MQPISCTGRVLVDEVKHKFSHRAEKEVVLHSTIWQPMLEKLNVHDCHLLSSTNGVILLVDGPEDRASAIYRFQRLLEIFPRGYQFPTLVILSTNPLNDCDDLIDIFKSLLDQVEYLSNSNVEAVHVAPFLKHLFLDIYWSIQNKWVEHFRSRGYQVETPIPYPQDWQQEADPAEQAIRCIAETGPFFEIPEESCAAKQPHRNIYLSVKSLEIRETENTTQDDSEDHGEEVTNVSDSILQYEEPDVKAENGVIKRRRLEENAEDKLGVKVLGDTLDNSFGSEKLQEMYSGQGTFKSLLDVEFLGLSIQEKFDILHARREGAWEKLKQQIKCWGQSNVSDRF